MSNEEKQGVEVQAKGLEQGPAGHLRTIQALLANGIFPGNVAPAVVKAYNVLEQMSLVIEAEAAKDDVGEVPAEPSFTEALKADIAEAALNDTTAE